MLRRVKPKAEDRAQLEHISGLILKRVEDLARSRGLDIRAMLVGSAARGTWLAGDHDLDIFLGMPESSNLNAALELAREVAPVHEEKYAEHAYVHARVDGFDVDLVPCYLVKEASKLQSAVDRTPFHTKYIARRVIGLEDDVLLLKQFMKGIGVYGSELKVGGFSGYLTELLVICYGSFFEVLHAASSWRPGEFIDLERYGCQRDQSDRPARSTRSDRSDQTHQTHREHQEHQTNQKHQEPLVVIDPVDPGRNVAAALTVDRMFQFSAASRCFLQHPDMDFFYPSKVEPLSDQELLIHLYDRKSCLILLEFTAPAVVEDVLFPQLRKAEESVRALLERSGFSMLRSDVGSYGQKAFLLFELEVWSLPKVSRRIGPPVWEAEHLSKFLSVHPAPLSGPYIEDGRAVVELPRKYTLASDLLAAELNRLSLGKHLGRAVHEGHNIYVGPGLVGIKDRDFRVFMAKYLKAKTRIC